MFHHIWLPSSLAAFLHNASFERDLGVFTNHPFTSLSACIKRKQLAFEFGLNFAIMQCISVLYNILLWGLMPWILAGQRKMFLWHFYWYLVGNAARTGQWWSSFTWQQTFLESVFKWMVKTTIRAMMLQERYLTRVYQLTAVLYSNKALTIAIPVISA